MRHLFLSSNGIAWADLLTFSARSAFFLIYTVSDQVLTNARRASLIFDMGLVFVSEIRDCAQDRIGCGLAEGTQRGLRYNPAQFFKELDISFFSFATGNCIDDLIHPASPIAARGTFSATLILQKIQKVFGCVNHTGLIVHDNHATRAHHRACFGEFVKIHLYVYQ